MLTGPCVSPPPRISVQLCSPLFYILLQSVQLCNDEWEHVALSSCASLLHLTCVPVPFMLLDMAGFCFSWLTNVPLYICSVTLSSSTYLVMESQVYSCESCCHKQAYVETGLKCELPLLCVDTHGRVLGRAVVLFPVFEAHTSCFPDRSNLYLYPSHTGAVFFLCPQLSSWGRVVSAFPWGWLMPSKCSRASWPAVYTLREVTI